MVGRVGFTLVEIHVGPVPMVDTVNNGFVVGEVGGGRLGSQTILPPQELHNTRRPVLGRFHLLERALHFFLEPQ